ncbi:MAG TPA: hypothetical protein VGL03_00720 [Thermoanaerobaculia bacterium]
MVIVRVRTVSAEVVQAGRCQSVRKADLRRGDRLLVATENSVYSIEPLEGSIYRICGGWFDRQGLSPVQTSIAGCTWGGSVIKNDVAAACGLHLEFGNRVITSRIREVHVIRDAASESGRFRRADCHELLLACYGARRHVSMAG